jgi:hypothetical protein
MTASQQSTDTDRCIRCHLPAPYMGSDAFLAWDPIGDEDAVICPQCLTEDEDTR